MKAHLQDEVDGFQTLAEEVQIQLLKTSPRDAAEEILTVKKGVQVNGSLRAHREGPLDTLAGGAQAAHRAGVAVHVLSVLPLKFLQCAFQCLCYIRFCSTLYTAGYP